MEENMTLKKADLNSCIDLFTETCFTPNCVKSLRESCLLGEVGNSPLRSIAWKLFLGVLSESKGIDQWIIETYNSRNNYRAKAKKYLGKKKLTGDPLGAMSAAPASSTGSQDWSNYYSDNEIKKIIELDLSRTYQEIDIFLKKETHNLLSNILFVWSKENDDVSYKQGMNELLAVFFLAFYPYYFKNNYKFTKDQLVQFAKENPKDKRNEIYSYFFDEKDLEADLYGLFDILMKKGIKDFFDISEGEQKMAGFNYKKHNLFNNSLTSGNEENVANTPLSYRCYLIVNDILKNVDEQLFEHFKKIGLEGNLFLQ